MTTDELRNLKANQTVDARGTACPGPLLAAKKAVGDIECPCEVDDHQLDDDQPKSTGK